MSGYGIPRLVITLQADVTKLRAIRVEVEQLEVGEVSDDV